MLQSGKFYIFQRALRRYARSGMYYSKAVPLAKEFTELVVARWERLALVTPRTNFSLEIQKQNNEESFTVTPCVQILNPGKYHISEELKPLVSPSTNFSLEIGEMKFSLTSAKLP